MILLKLIKQICCNLPQTYFIKVKLNYKQIQKVIKFEKVVKISELFCILFFKGIPIGRESLFQMSLSVLFLLVTLGDLLELLSVDLHVGSHDSHCDSVYSGVPVLVRSSICIYETAHDNRITFLEVGTH